MMRLRTWGMFIQHLQHFLPCNWVNSIWGNALRTCTQLYPCLYLAKIISTVKISHKNGGNTTRTWRALCILHSFYFIYRVLKNWRPRRLLLPLSQHQKVIKSLRLVSLHWLTDCPVGVVQEQEAVIINKFHAFGINFVLSKVRFRGGGGGTTKLILHTCCFIYLKGDICGSEIYHQILQNSGQSNYDIIIIK